MNNFVTFCIVILSAWPLKPAQSVMTIAQTKTALQRENLAGQECKVKGYFYYSTIPMLVTNIKWTQVNTPMPDSVYLVLGGKWLKDNKAEFVRLQGKLVVVTGRPNLKKRSSFDQEDIPDLLLTQAPIIRSNYR